MVGSTSKSARVAGALVCAVFVPFVLIHLLWAAGITWGLEEMFGEWTGEQIDLTFASLIGAAAGGAVIFVTISRVGWHTTRLPNRLLHLGNWVAFAWPAIGTLNPGTTWGMRAVTVPLAIAAFTVARSRPQRHGRKARPLVTRAPVAH